MRRGYLSEHFEGIAAKRLAAVEAHPERSNQHEFDGVSDLKRILGEDRQKFDAQFIYLGSRTEDIAADGLLTSGGFLTWYDAREQHPTRSEYRLYFPSTSVTERAREGDLLIIGKLPNGTLLVVIAEAGTTAENQVKWLFGLNGSVQNRFTIANMDDEGDRELGYAGRLILDGLGIEATQVEPDYLEQLQARFGAEFPQTRVFSAFARETLPEVTASDDADQALMAWLDREETLFRAFERYLLEERLQQGFDDVEAFISVSLSVQNRRKSRAGYALENHLREILEQRQLLYSQGAETENRSKPDFLFPGATHYRDETFPIEQLTMLGAKSSCKERWRQVLAEAARINRKHLLTLEPGISENQTEEMEANRLQLVIPRELSASYTVAQREWLIDLEGFLALVQERQADLSS